ncbi:MAG: hypothetical protein BGN88_11340, partial [Clostridiales bacterium 43-6]
FLILTFILILSINANADTKFISIGLKYSDTAILECTLLAGSGFIVNTDSENNIQLAETKLSIKRNQDNNIDIINPQNGKVISTYNAFEILPADLGTMIFNDTEYRGNLRFSVVNNKIHVLNYILIEDYLKSVVPSEIVASWNFEALKAQAVCARNYALTNLGKFSKYGFDLDDTINSQVYKGVKSEHPNTTKAVAETAGQILMVDGKPATTLFFSSSGGHTESAKYVWGNDFSYLVGVKDPYEEIKEWKVNYTPDEITAKLSAKKVDIGTIVNLESVERSPSNRVINLLIKGDKGAYTLKLEGTRSFFNLKSNLYDISKNQSDSLVEVITKNGIEKRQLSGKIITKNGIFSLDGAIISYDFVGKGNGHGVGMSQYGAKGLADNGYTYEQILKHYFTGSYLSSETTVK